ncbi:hypothetical protein [Xenorhabdus sp. KJ12.1]|uniref:phage integrase n=1 Tax=Xenorhabdus sp. KJ12.1 TaxID=1851571 RepID=UPI000C03FE9E|nr:hypothetical protein [Xenorhabdus sp. KJ12.1]PHM66940.1 integrase [Xenorhabdus sp. KJ12.1]
MRSLFLSEAEVKKAEAVAFERYTLAHAPKPGKSSNRQSLSDLLKLWWLYHGQIAENGTIEKRQLEKTIKLLNDPSITTAITAVVIGSCRIGVNLNMVGTNQ